MGRELKCGVGSTEESAKARIRDMVRFDRHLNVRYPGKVYTTSALQQQIAELTQRITDTERVYARERTRLLASLPKYFILTDDDEIENVVDTESGTLEAASFDMYDDLASRLVSTKSLILRDVDALSLISEVLKIADGAAYVYFSYE